MSSWSPVELRGSFSLLLLRNRQPISDPKMGLCPGWPPTTQKAELIDFSYAPCGLRG
jgi:hypothetical protein